MKCKQIGPLQSSPCPQRRAPNALVVFRTILKYHPRYYCQVPLQVMLLPILILLPEKFLSFDWLRAEVFQLNLKYLHVKIKVTMVTPNHQVTKSSRRTSYAKMAERFRDFEISRLKN